MFPALTPAARLVRVEKFVYGNVKKGDELVEGIEAGVLASVLNIHDRVRGEVYKLGQVLLRPAFGFSSALDFLAQGAAVQTFSYWYILTSPLYYFTLNFPCFSHSILKMLINTGFIGILNQII